MKRVTPFADLKSLFIAVLSLLLLVGNQTVLAADPVDGRKVYRQFCQSCHGAKGTDRLRGQVDFSLGEGLMITDSSLKRRIERGKGFCPSFRGVIRAENIYNVIAYLRTLH